jgi:hypothetical protein
MTMLIGMKWQKLFFSPPPKTVTTVEIKSIGFTKGPNLSPDLLKQAIDIYSPRGNQVVPKVSGHPFVNLFKADDIHPDNPIFRFAFSPEVLDTAADYFGGRLILDSIQVLYSYPTVGALRESQYWHLDYGDRKALHCVTYLNDVLVDDDGPFGYVNKFTTNKIGRSMILRRIPDEQFNRELKDGRAEKFLGSAGSSIIIDPSACYHYGSRCKTPRFASFVTFSTWFPFAQPNQLVVQNAQKILVAARKVRPDLSEVFLKTFLQLS